MVPVWYRPIMSLWLVPSRDELSRVTVSGGAAGDRGDLERRYGMVIAVESIRGAAS